MSYGNRNILDFRSDDFFMSKLVEQGNTPEEAQQIANEMDELSVSSPDKYAHCLTWRAGVACGYCTMKWDAEAKAAKIKRRSEPPTPEQQKSITDFVQKHLASCAKMQLEALEDGKMPVAMLTEEMALAAVAAGELDPAAEAVLSAFLDKIDAVKGDKGKSPSADSTEELPPAGKHFFEKIASRGCSNPNCDCHKKPVTDEPGWIVPDCHPDAKLKACYDPKGGTVKLWCGTCGRHVLNIALAE